jgi:putative adenylate-forming enzyme
MEEFPLIFYLLSRYRFRHWSHEDIARYQARRQRIIVDYAKRHSPFFRQLFTDTAAVTNKKVMMDNLSDYNTLGLAKDDLIGFALDIEEKRDFGKRWKGINIGMSSGTSGNKGIIITTRHEEAYLKAMYLARLTLPKGRLNCAFILRVSSPAFDFSLFGNRLTYVSQLQPIESMMRQLERIDPNVVSGPPSMLKLLAQRHQQGELNIRPKLIYSYAEVLYPDVKLFLERSFGCRVLEIYQGSEGCYAISCSEGSLHINEDIVKIELLDRDGILTKEGRPSFRMLVTDLHKRSQPIIRYEVNDIITLSRSRCRCGSNFRVIESIQGRADDMLWGIRPDGSRHFIYQDYISRKIITLSDDIDDFQVIQKTLTSIIVRLKLKKGDKTRLKTLVMKGLQSVFEQYDCKKPAVKVIFGDPIPNQNSNKLARIICEIRK